MKDYQNKSIDVLASGSAKFIFPCDKNIELKKIDTRIRDIILQTNISSPQILKQMDQLRGRLHNLLSKINLEQNQVHKPPFTCNPETREIQGELSSHQKRWLKYFSVEKMTSDEIEVFNSWAYSDLSLEEIEIDKLMKTVDAISTLYSNDNIPKAIGHANTERNIVIESYRDRYSLSHTSVVMLSFVQVKLLAEDLFFLLTSLIRSLYFLSLSEKVRVQLLNHYCRVEQLLGGKSKTAKAAKNLVLRDTTVQNKSSKYKVADRQLDKMGKELILRSIGQLSLILKTIKLIKVRNSEHWQITVAKAKSKAITNASRKKKEAEVLGNRVHWRQRLQWGMTLKMDELPEPHVFAIDSRNPILDRYNQLMQQVGEIEDIVQTSLFDLKGPIANSDIEMKGIAAKKNDYLDDNGRLPEWADW